MPKVFMANAEVAEDVKDVNNFVVDVKMQLRHLMGTVGPLHLPTAMVQLISLNMLQMRP